MGRNSIAVLLVQDMAVVPLAVLIPLLGNTSGSGTMLPRIFGIVLAGGGVVAALYLLLNLLAVRVMKTRSIGQNRELMVLLSVIVGLGAHGLLMPPDCRRLWALLWPVCTSETRPSPCRFVLMWHP